MRPVIQPVTRPVASTTRASGGGGGGAEPRALAFTGAAGDSNYIHFPDWQSEFHKNTFTIAAWLKLEANPGNHGIASKVNMFDSYIQSVGDRPRTITRGTAGIDVFATASNWPFDGTWAHYMCACDTTSVHHYRDGVADGQKTAQPTWTVGASTGPLQIGVHSIQSTFLFVGKMVDFRFWGEKLTATEAAYLAAKNTASVPDHAELGWWKFNDADPSTIVTDSSGNGYHGIAVNTTAVYTGEDIPVTF